MHILIVLLTLIVLPVISTKEQFRLVGMFTITSTDSPNIRETYGVYPREAARLAVEHVREEGLLAEHNYELQLLEFETTCDQIGAVTANLEYKAFDSAPNFPYALVGPVCSVSTGLIATITSRYIKAVQVSYGVLSPEFSDVEAYPYFYRTVPDFTAYVEPVTAILEYFDWQVIGIVQSDNVRYGLLTELLTTFFGTQNIDFKIPTTLSVASHYRFEGRGLQNSVRIFLAMVDETMGADTLCAAYHSGLTGRDFVWILLGDYFDGWWLHLQKMQCTEEQMLEAIESMIILSNTRQISDENFGSIIGQNKCEFWNDFSRYLKQNTGLNFVESQTPRVLQSYDAVWTIAKALNITLTEGNFTSTAEDRESVGVFNNDRVQRLHRALNRNMKKLSFRGASGNIEFSDEFNSPQQPVTTIFQVQNGSVTPVGIYEESYFDFTFFESNLTWRNGEPPRDRPIIMLQLVELWIILVTLVLTAVVIVYAIVILVINIVYRKHKVIKASSPYINILIIVGCIIALLAIPVLSVENLDVDNILPDPLSLFFCNIRMWLIHIALTLAFGSLFAKTWRVYMIFRNPWAKARPYKDHVLLCIVGALLVVDVLLLSLSTWRVPLMLNTYTFPSYTEQFAMNDYRACLNLYDIKTEFLVWLGVQSGTKVLMFLFGIFLVVQTSKIKAKFFKDSRFIGICIYATVTTVGVGVPSSLAFLFSLQEDLSYTVAAGTILFTTFFILTMVFIPRFLLLRKYKNSVPTAVLVGLNPSFRNKRTLAVNKKRVVKESRSADDGLEASKLIRSHVANHPDLSSSEGSNDIMMSEIEWEPAYDEEPVSPTTITPQDICPIESSYVSFGHQHQCAISDGLTQCHFDEGINNTSSLYKLTTTSL